MLQSHTLTLFYSNSRWNSYVAAQNKLRASRVANIKFKIALNCRRNTKKKRFFSMRILYLFPFQRCQKSFWNKSNFEVTILSLNFIASTKNYLNSRLCIQLHLLPISLPHIVSFIFILKKSCFHQNFTEKIVIAFTSRYYKNRKNEKQVSVTVTDLCSLAIDKLWL